MGADLVDLQGSNSLGVFGWRVSSPVIAQPEASMGRACSSHIWLNSMALTSRALSWPWELASGCGKGIVFPNTGALCCLCVIAYMCLCMITLTTQQARHLWHLGCAQGQLQLCHLMEKGGRYSHAVAPPLSAPGSAESQKLQPSYLLLLMVSTPKLHFLSQSTG